MKRIGLYVAWLIAAVMLVSAATGKHPYSFYTLLRWVCCAAFAYSAFTAFRIKRVAWTLIFAVLAVVFNPLAPFYLQRQTWQIIDWASIAVIVFTAIIFWRRDPEPRARTPDRKLQANGQRRLSK